MNRLITEDERRQLLAHGRARAGGEAIDPLPVVRLFTPDAHAIWLLAALDPEDGDTAYGLCDIQMRFIQVAEGSSVADYSFNVSRLVQFEGHIFLFASGKGSAGHKYC